MSIAAMHVRRLAPLILALLCLTGCGGHSHAIQPVKLSVCPQAADGRGSMGVCAPKAKLGLTVPRPATSQGPTYPDRSNNDPCDCGTAIRDRGYAGLIVKANQGTGYIDPTAVGMVESARTAGLAVGVYDFDQDYSLAEARVLVARAQAAGIYPSSRNTFPLTFDVEYGSFSYSGLAAQIRYVRSLGYRVQVYTGAWYWGPHAGCRWIGVPAWLSGYPSAPAPCGLSSGLYVAHQFTDTPTDLTVFLGSRAAFERFVNDAPKPRSSTFSIYPEHPIKLYGQRVSERSTVERWWARSCSNPVKRSVCRTTRRHLQWFAGRLVRLASQGRDRGEFNLPPNWSSRQARRLHWPQRHYRIERILKGSGR